LLLKSKAIYKQKGVERPQYQVIYTGNNGLGFNFWGYRRSGFAFGNLQ
jgi:hypothetical protein